MNLAVSLAVKLVRLYQKIISPLTGKRSCRFHPTCSTYTVKALKKYGLLKGSWIAVKRILRCHPFNSGGYDPLD